MQQGIYTEKAFEDAIEASLLEHGGYLHGDTARYNKELALFPQELFAFIADTQGVVLEGLRAQLKERLEAEFLASLTKNLEQRGMLDVLRHGIKFYGKLIYLAYFRPPYTLNPDTLARYAKNRLTITRQLAYSTQNENKLDLVLSVNGLPVVTIELKNAFTGQQSSDAKQQYLRDRGPDEPLFRFTKRTLVHFAVDADTAYMTTRLAGGKTYFLPFNKGKDGGAGNPDNPDGYRTAYLWEEALTRDSLLDILHRFMHFGVEEKVIEGKKVRKEIMIFPRYHQLEVVRQLETDAGAHGPGKNYLIQHSAGSGKSNSIAWLAHRLSYLHKADNTKVFDSVVVITDRRVLDKQLQDTIYQFEHKQGVVVKVDKDSKQLADALKTGTPIIIATLQKFPFAAVIEGIDAMPNRTYAVIVDEAHSSQSGDSSKELKKILSSTIIRETAAQYAVQKAAEEGGKAEDYEEEIIRTMLARGQQPNLSFFAFTATPKAKTLEVFGVPGADGKPHPFHLYTMRQAIDEGFILDVLKGYITYHSYFELIKQIEDDPTVDKKKAGKALARFLSLHPHNLAQKIEVIVEHFRTVTRHKIGGRAKAMVVTGSRLHAVRYKQTFDEYIKKKGYTDIRTLVAFSGTVVDDKDPSITYTETAMNGGIKETELPDKFACSDYQVLLVAEKYQTGFDQPLLHTMYVDKRLSGIQAVQTLSRLNRTCPGKEETFVLDFVNEAEEIVQSFQPYYEQTTVAKKADPQQLYTIQLKLNAAQVYYQSEVESFCKVFFKPKAKQTKTDHAQMNVFIDPGVDRFAALEEEQQDNFRGTLAAYLRLYSFLAQILPYQDADLEMLYAYGRFLLSKLPKRDGGPAYSFDDEVALKYYRLQKISEGGLTLETGQVGEIPGPTAVGTGQIHEDEIELSELINVINKRFGTDFSESDLLYLEQVTGDAVSHPALQQAASANTLDHFKFMWDKILPVLFYGRSDRNQEVADRIMCDPELLGMVSTLLMKQVYEQIRTTGDASM